MTTLLFAIDDRPDLAHTRDKTTSHSFIHSHILYAREWKKKHAFWCSPYLSIRRIMANRLANRRRMRAKKHDRRASKGRWTEKTNVVPSGKWRGQKKAAEDQPLCLGYPNIIFFIGCSCCWCSLLCASSPKSSPGIPICCCLRVLWVWWVCTVFREAPGRVEGDRFYIMNLAKSVCQKRIRELFITI